jgi:hypothetical protein
VGEGVLTFTSRGAFSADRLIHLKQGEQRISEGIFHPRPPEAVELAPEDRQRIRDRFVAVPPQTHVEQVQAEGPIPFRDVEDEDIVTSAWRHQTEHCVGEVAVRVDEHECRWTTIVRGGLHEVAGDAGQE